MLEEIQGWENAFLNIMACGLCGTAAKANIERCATVFVTSRAKSNDRVVISHPLKNVYFFPTTLLILPFSPLWFFSNPLTIEAVTFGWL